MNIIDGLKGSTIIDDSYNSSPTALAVALAALAEIEGAGRKIAVLGDMMELGQYSADEHKKAGALVAKSLDQARGDLLVTVGQRAKGMREGALSAGMSESSIVSFDASTKRQGSSKIWSKQATSSWSKARSLRAWSASRKLSWPIHHTLPTSRPSGKGMA